MAKRKPQVSDIYKCSYTDGRYEDTYYLILTEPLAVIDGVTTYKCINLNFGTKEVFHYFPYGKRQADDNVWEIMEKYA